MVKPIGQNRSNVIIFEQAKEVSPMLSNERHSQLLSYLEQNKTVTVQDLAAKVFASPSTIRRDLSELEQQGLLKRVHGGAVLTTGSALDPPWRLHQVQQMEEKRRIARTAMSYLSNSTSYFFDSSTTAALLALKLRDFLDVKIATNGLGILSSLTSTKNLLVISCGGSLRSPYDEFIGNLALQNISQMNADIFFFSCAGFSAGQSATEINDGNVAVKRAFYRNSKQHILLCDCTKFGKEFFFNSFALHEIDYVITDRRPSDLYVDLLGDKLVY